jgi:hypothetical protein
VRTYEPDKSFASSWVEANKERKKRKGERQKLIPRFLPFSFSLSEEKMNHHQHEMRRRRIEDCRVRLRRFHRNAGLQISAQTGNRASDDTGNLNVMINDSSRGITQSNCADDAEVEVEMAGEARG